MAGGLSREGEAQWYRPHAPETARTLRSRWAPPGRERRCSHRQPARAAGREGVLPSSGMARVSALSSSEEVTRRAGNADLRAVLPVGPGTARRSRAAARAADQRRQLSPTPPCRATRRQGNADLWAVLPVGPGTARHRRAEARTADQRRPLSPTPPCRATRGQGNADLWAVLPVGPGTARRRRAGGKNPEFGSGSPLGRDPGVQRHPDGCVVYAFRCASRSGAGPHQEKRP